MTRIDRYVLSEWLKVFALTLLATCGLLIVERIQDNLSDLQRLNVAPMEIARFYLLQIPVYLPVVLPLAVLVSVLYSLGQMHRRSELVALQAAGWSLWRVSRWLWVAGGVLALLMLYLNATLLPQAIEGSRRLWDRYRYADAVARAVDEDAIGLVYNLTFHHQRENRLWFINRFNLYTYRAYGIQVSKVDERGREGQRLVANEGYYDELRRAWVFLDGRTTRFDEQGDAVNSLPFAREEWVDIDEDPTLMTYLKRRPRELSLFQVRRVVSTLTSAGDSHVSPYRVRYYQILLNPLSVLVVMGLAVPFAARGVRANALVNVAWAGGLFAVYFVLQRSGQVLGSHLLSPLWAALLPSLLTLAVAAHFLWRVNRPQ